MVAHDIKNTKKVLQTNNATLKHCAPKVLKPSMKYYLFVPCVLFSVPTEVWPVIGHVCKENTVQSS